VKTKLIRDKYIEHIAKDRLFYEKDHRKQFEFLLKKLKEELAELEETDYNDIDEWADVLDVIYAMLSHKEIYMDEVLLNRKIKNIKFGGFDDFLILRLNDQDK